MSSRWRIITTVLGLATVLLWWQNCNLRTRLQAADKALGVHRADRESTAGRGSSSQRSRTRSPELPTDSPEASGGIDPIEPPSAGVPLRLPYDIGRLIAMFAPHSGEDLLSYKERVVPEAVRMLEPQRQRVRGNLDEFADEAGLDDETVDAFEDAAITAAEKMRDRVIEGVLSGELRPPFRPSSVVGVAHDLTGILDGMVTGFRDRLTDAQIEALADSRFDPIDYMVFATRWEEMLP